MNRSAKTTILKHEYISSLIENGSAIVIYKQLVFKLDGWLKYHPGGEKSILHMVGRDATDQINAFHSEETLKSMFKYQIGVVEGKWDNLIPPIQRASEGKNVLELGPENNNKRCGDGESSASSRSSSVFEDSGVKSRGRGVGSRTSSTSSLSDDGSTLAKDTHADSHDARTSAEQVEVDEDAIVSSFRELVLKLEAQGLYDCIYWAYLLDAIRIFCIGATMLLLLHYKQYFLSSIALGTFWHQLVFIAHDAGHLGITHNYTLDTAIGLTLASTLGGLSLTWWKTNHNIHHIATNSPSHDPDIQHLPFLAITPSFFSSLYSTYYSRIMPYTPFAANMMLYQQYMYYPILCFGRFNLYVLSWQHLLLNRGPKNKNLQWQRPVEILGQIVFWYWFGYRLIYLSLPSLSTRIMYVLISHAVTMPLHVQFTLSHFAMDTQPSSSSPQNENWPTQQLRTTMDVDCPPWLDWFHGGLQFQAIHHLFPRLPRHNLRRTSEFVKKWAEEVGVKYEVYGFVECNGRVLGKLEEVGRQAGYLREAHRKVVEKGDWLKGEWE